MKIYVCRTTFSYYYTLKKKLKNKKTSPHIPSLTTVSNRIVPIYLNFLVLNFRFSSLGFFPIFSSGGGAYFFSSKECNIFLVSYNNLKKKQNKITNTKTKMKFF